jgi:hypothetical protein
MGPYRTSHNLHFQFALYVILVALCILVTAVSIILITTHI